MPEAYNDIDFCLRMRETGYRIVWTPEAELYRDGTFSSNAESNSAADRSLRIDTLKALG